MFFLFNDKKLKLFHFFIMQIIMFLDIKYFFKNSKKMETNCLLISDISYFTQNVVLKWPSFVTPPALYKDF